MLTLRPAEPRDLPSLLALVHMLARHHGDTPALRLADLDRDLFAPHPWLHVIVAEVKAGLAGYAALLPKAQLQHGMRGMDLHHLFVISRLRGTGIGKALVSASIAHAEAMGCASLTVSTTDENMAAQAFYLAQGFDLSPGSGQRFSLELAKARVEDARLAG